MAIAKLDREAAVDLLNARLSLATARLGRHEEFFVAERAAVIGVPGLAGWNPVRQRDVIACLIEAGADPNAAAAGGVTPLHRALRNRCSAAVEAEQRVVIELLETSTA